MEGRHGGDAEYEEESLASFHIQFSFGVLAQCGADGAAWERYLIAATDRLAGCGHMVAGAGGGLLNCSVPAVSRISRTTDRPYSALCQASMVGNGGGGLLTSTSMFLRYESSMVGS